VKDCREIGLHTMSGNTTIGTTEVDVRGERVTFDGLELTAEPVDAVSLSRLYFL
jgi:urease alpha subunit